jgi:hypothetical protein
MESLLDDGDVVGQQRCNSGKRIVVFKKSHPQYVFKGPFNEPVNGKVDAYAILNYRTAWLKYWNSSHVLLPDSEYLFPSTFYGDKSPSKAFVFPNILQRFPTKSTRHTESFKTNGIHLSYMIQEGSSMMKLSKYLQDPNIPRVDKIKILTYELLRDYVLLYILGVGDVGLHNTMISGQSVYIIDYDETRKHGDNNRPLFFFNKDPAAKDGLRDMITSIFRPMYGRLAKELEQLTVAKDMNSLKDEAVVLLRNYVLSTPSEIPFLSSSQSGIPVRQEFNKEDLPPGPFPAGNIPTQNLPKHPSKPFEQEPVRQEQQEPVRQEQQEPVRQEQQEPVRQEQQEPVRQEQQEPVRQEQQEPVRQEQQEPVRQEQQEPVRQEMGTLDINLFIQTPFVGGIKGRGKLQFSGMNASITPLGLSPSLVKSVLQKNIRRGEFVQSTNAAFEMYAFKDVKINDEKRAMCLVSNMYNRLAVIAAEDVSPVSLRIAAYINGWVVNWVKQGKDTFKTLGSDGDRYDPYRLVGNIWLLASSSKSRLASHLWTAYAKPEGRVLSEKYGLRIESLDSSSLTVEDMECGLGKEYEFVSTDYEIDEGRMVLTACIIYNRLMIKDPNAIGWISHFIDKYGKEKVKGRGKRLSTIILWDIFSVIGISGDILDPLREAYFTLSETRPALMAVVTNILYGDKDESLNPTEFDQYRNGMLKYQYVNDLMNGNYTLEIKDYMVDKHSGLRGDPIELRNKFTTLGAHVENEDMDLSSDLLKQIYIEAHPPILPLS